MKMNIKELKAEIKKYPKTKNITGLKKPELVALLNELQNSNNKLEGEGLDALFTGIQKDYREEAKRNIKQYGSFKIDHIQVTRTPIMSVVDKALNFISLGKWNQAKKKMSFDSMFHLNMIIKIGKVSLVVEKLEKINVSRSYTISKKTEVMNVPINHVNLNLNQLLNNARQKYGDNRFFMYDGFNKNLEKTGGNCQRFILDLLTASNINNPQVEAFVMQDINTLAKNIQGFVPKVARTVTNIANKATEVIGLGNPKNVQKYSLKDFM